jgi:hypothetical protein
VDWSGEVRAEIHRVPSNPQPRKSFFSSVLIHQPQALDSLMLIFFFNDNEIDPVESILMFVGGDISRMGTSVIGIEFAH